jgi:hypothetical protein
MHSLAYFIGFASDFSHLPQPVGWFERSETHPTGWRGFSFYGDVPAQ